MKSQTEIAKEMAKHLDVHTLDESRNLELIMIKVAESNDRKWRDGSPFISRDIVNSIRIMLRACTERRIEIGEKEYPQSYDLLSNEKPPKRAPLTGRRKLSK